jgi:hypothetical protein
MRGLPTPLIFVYRTAVPDTGQAGMAVVDGQQRLSAVFDFLDGKYRLSGADIKQFRGLRFERLPWDAQIAILSYGMVVEELDDLPMRVIRDIFTRLNKYGVRLSPQELRHAREDGAFKRTVEEVGGWQFWTAEGILSQAKAARMRTDEFAAELLILLAEAAPQDKKAAINQYYVAFADKFPNGNDLVARLKKYVVWTRDALPDDPRTRFRKTVDFYSLVGALDRVSDQGKRLSDISTERARLLLESFSSDVASAQPSRRAARYLIAASRQTDNLIPRSTRIGVLADLLEEVAE